MFDEDATDSDDLVCVFVDDDSGVVGGAEWATKGGVGGAEEVETGLVGGETGVGDDG